MRSHREKNYRNICSTLTFSLGRSHKLREARITARCLDKKETLASPNVVAY